MAGPQYIELHARSAFSFHRGASGPEELTRQAAELELPAIAVTDRDGVYGSPRVHARAAEAGIRGIVGAELTLEDGAVLPVLVRNRSGYQNLCRLLTQAKLRSPKNASRIGWEEIGEFAEGLICLTGDEDGVLHRHLRHEETEQAELSVRRLIHLFGRDNVAVEIQRRHLRGEDRLVSRSVQLAGHLGLPLVATNGVLHATPDRRRLLDVFTCLRHHVHLDTAGELLAPNGERHLKSAVEMGRLFADLPGAVSESLRIAERCEFTLTDLGYRFPDFPVKPGDTMVGRLHRETNAGARRRYGDRIPQKVEEQIRKELAIIDRLGFAGYFLIVHDLIRYCAENDILVQGRGSAANSAVCFCLGITAVDPVKHELLFERFLSEGQGKWPDIDLDLPSGDRRESVIQEVYRRFAPHGAGMTANVITYRGRSVMRETGKALNLPEDVLGRFSNLFPHGDYPETRELIEQVVQAGLPRNHPRLEALVSLYQMAYGLPRHLGQHSGGMVICTQGLDSIVPLEPAAMPGRTVVQWDKDDCEDLGIIKIDLLGLGMMAALQDCRDLCHNRGPAREFDLARIPTDDPETYRLMQRADTVGVFQIESRAQMATLPRMQPREFYDVAIEVAIIRPGPIAGNLTHPYLDRRAGLKPVTYLHPSLEPVLRRTLGVPLFQEQMLQIAMIMADFTGSEASELRRAISFNRSAERMEKVIARLREKMTTKGVEPDVQEEIINSIGSFALYGFPESHAISFGLLAYCSTWLKAHRPVEFYTALLNNQPMGFYSSDSLIKDARRHGIRTRPVDVTVSDWHSTVESDDSLRLGFHIVNQISHGAAQRILTERQHATFASLEDLLIRTRLNKDERRVLAGIGALNSLAGDRRTALWQVEKKPDPDDLFFELPLDTGPALNPMTAAERLEADYRGQDLSTGPHPMALLRPQLPEAWTAADLTSAANGQDIQIAGLVICRQRPGTAKGNLFLSLEDETGISNAFVPAATFEAHRLLLTQERFLVIEGPVQMSRGVCSILARDIRALPAGQLRPGASHDFR